MRIATKPLNKEAVASANKTVDQKYCPAPQPGDPNYGAYRRDWMDAYEAGGGRTSKASEKERKEQVRKDRAKAKSRRGNRGAVTSCPAATGQSGGNGGGSPSPSSPAPKPAPPPAAKTDDCPCKLTALEVTCSHGRSAKNNLLMVVQSNAFGDAMTVTPNASGDCASRLAVRADGQDGYPAMGAKTSGFHAKGPVAGDLGLFSLWKASPISTMVSAEACGTAVQAIKVDAYPSKKVSIKIDLKEVKEKYRGILAYLPVDTGSPRLAMKPLNAPKDDNWEAKKFVPVLSAEAQWAEDGGSNLAYCEMSINGGLDPLIGVEASFPIYGIPVPPMVAKYVKAGIYLNVGISAAITASCAWAYWPHEDKTHWRSLKLEIKGGGTAELAAELLILSPDALQAKAAGKTEVTIKGWGEKESETQPAIKWAAEWKPLTVGVVFKLAWGLFESERSWPLFEPIKTPDTDDYKYVFK